MVRTGHEPGIAGSQGKRLNHKATLPPSVEEDGFVDGRVTDWQLETNPFIGLLTIDE